MTYDYMTRVVLNRPVTEKEASRRVDVRRPVADEAADAYAVFGMNDTYLEICDASFFQVGWCHHRLRQIPRFVDIGLKGIIKIAGD
ncbi:hypothetical protein LMG22037_06572 [Paraburkholderia phenoliruptrix]|uniref:Uncharacterized protein n=2 Tax=Paraburkholderia phenoliruptrix TaxID=252970 RepID=A0A6J5CP43_9BURK|nr:hypothetical protein LMG22037_06572 [Paraburkholderia phenoliruptrix]